MSGIFGCVTGKKNCTELLFYGTDYHSHLGTGFGGMAVYGDELVRKIHDISQAQFKSKFSDEYEKLSGSRGIGVISAKEEQPVYIYSRFGPMCLCMDGIIENWEELAHGLTRHGLSFTEVKNGKINEAEIVAKLINQGKTIVNGIEKMSRMIKGSCSLLLLTKEGIYAARDRYGYTPLVVGCADHTWAVSSETSSFPNLGLNIQKFLEPGEIVLINESGIKQKRGGGNVNQICSFLWIYTGFPASSYEGINVELVRERSGKALASRDTVRADLAAGVPDSGTTHAIGYAMEKKIPFRRPLVKYTPGYDRSYTPPSQARRDLIARMKLVPIKEVINGKKIVICDDSIVRGTQLKNFTIQKLWDNGAKEIHVRIACPPLMFPCRFNLSTRTTHELAARRAIKQLEKKDIENVAGYIDSGTPKYRKMVELIAKDIGVTSLMYQTTEDMLRAIGLPKESVCLYCWTGRAPDVKK